MKLQTVKNELWSVARVYPTLAGLLQKKLDDNTGTVGNHWAKLLCDLHPGHFSDVCDEYATCAKPLPNPIDQLCFEILSEAKARAWKEEDALRVHELRLQGRKVPWRDETNVDRFSTAMRLAYNGANWSEEQAEAVCKWANHGEAKPDFLEAGNGAQSNE